MEAAVVVVVIGAAARRRERERERERELKKARQQTYSLHSDCPGKSWYVPAMQL